MPPMPPQPPSPSALFLVRVWLDGELLRARITQSHDLVNGDETVAIVGSAAEVEQRLRDWLVAIGR